MENPFVYGEVVPAAAFVDRVDELDRLVRDLARLFERRVETCPPCRAFHSRLLSSRGPTSGPVRVTP